MQSICSALSIHLHFRVLGNASLRVELIKEWVEALEENGWRIHHLTTESSATPLPQIEWQQLKAQRLISGDICQSQAESVAAEWRHYQWLKSYQNREVNPRISAILVIHVGRSHSENDAELGDCYSSVSPEWLARQLGDHLRLHESANFIPLFSCERDGGYESERTTGQNFLVGYYVTQDALASLLNRMLPLGSMRESLASDAEKLVLSKKQVKVIGGVENAAAEGQQAGHFRWREDSPMAFVTCYFNPCKFLQRQINTLRFLRQPHLPNLVVVELAFGEEPWQLPDHTPNLIRVRSNSVLWQKEALLNIGIKHLINAGFKYVGWLDADVEFENEQWKAACLNELEKAKLCQVFETVKVEFPDIGPRLKTGCVACYELYEKLPEECLVTGFGWVMQSDVLRTIGLYDRNTLGGGDRVMWRALFDNAAGIPLESADDQNEKQGVHATHFWFNQWRNSLNRSVSFARGVRIRTYPHGRHKNRRYRTRREILSKSGFDAQVHIVKTPNGVWEWNWDEVPDALVQLVEAYFLSRLEDEI